ncbi:MAG: hypothetical protein WD114_01565 [Phycisphaerales bacterium]
MSTGKRGQPERSRRNTLGMDNNVYNQLLKKLNSPSILTGTGVGKPKSKAKVARKYTRLEYNDPYLELYLETIDRSTRTITVASRNISRGGMSVLHSSFVYTGTFATAKLERIDGTTHAVSGKVVRCEHRGGVVHEIGIKFDREIIVQEFVRPDINDAVRSLESVQPERLAGKLLIVGDDPIVMPLFREYLLCTSINYGFVDTADEALDKDLQQHDLIFSCMDAGTMSGPEFATYLREVGYNKPVILAGRADDEFTRNQIRLSSADMFVPTPLDEGDLLCALGEYLLAEWTESALANVRSRINPETIESLRQELAKLGIVLDQQIRTNDAVKIYATCSKIRSIAPLLGMKLLRDLTLKVGEEIAHTGDHQVHAEILGDIKLMCSSVNRAA